MKVDSFGDRLDKRLKEKNMSQRELSRKTGIAVSSISQYISGINSPRQDKIEKIAHALDVSISWLLGYDFNESNKTADKYFNNDDEIFFNKAIGKLCNFIRIKNNYTLDSINKNLGFSINEITSYENGDFPIPAVYLIMLGILCDYDFKELKKDLNYCKKILSNNE